MGKRNGALLLVNPSSVPTTTCDHLTANCASISTGYLFGGTDVGDRHRETESTVADQLAR